LHEAQSVPGQQMMVQEIELVEVDIDGRTFWVRPVGSWVLESGKGGRPELTVDFKAVCDATLMVSNSSGEAITDIANRFGVSRGWIHKWDYPVWDYPVSVSKPQRYIRN